MSINECENEVAIFGRGKLNKMSEEMSVKMRLKMTSIAYTKSPLTEKDGEA